MKILLLILMIASFAFPMRVEKYIRKDVETYLEKYNKYDYKKLERLAEEYLDGEIDTNLMAPIMVHKFLTTSKIGKSINHIEFTNTGRDAGRYFFKDSTITISDKIKNKKVIMYILLHELTHAIQHNNGFYEIRDRETIVINELYADYISSFFGLSIRQGPYLLSLYLDTIFLTEKQYINQSYLIHKMYIEVGNRLEKRKFKREFAK